MYQPNDIIIVPEEETLSVLSDVVDDADPGHEEDDLLVGGVVEVVPTLMPAVAVHPLQPQL